MVSFTDLVSIANLTEKIKFQPSKKNSSTIPGSWMVPGPRGMILGQGESFRVSWAPATARATFRLEYLARLRVLGRSANPGADLKIMKKLGFAWILNYEPPKVQSWGASASLAFAC